MADKFVEEKEEFVDALQKRGYKVEDDHGCVMAVVKKDVYRQATEEIRALASEMKYDMSFGVKMRQQE